MNRLYSYLCLLIFGYLVVSGCKRDREEDPFLNVALISKAKVYFESSVNTKDNNKISLNKNAKNPRKSLSKETLWDKAYTRTFAIGEVVCVPLKFSGSITTKSHKTDSLTSLDKLSYLLIYSYEGKMQAEVVTCIPDSSYQSSNRTYDFFTGIVIVENWKGDFLKSFLYTEHEVNKKFIIQ